MKKILIADDEPMMAKLAARALRDGYEILTVSSGAEALEIFEAEKPDLVISDVKMPGMSGFELCAHKGKIRRGRALYLHDGG